MRNTTPLMEGEALQLRRSLEYELIARCDKNEIDNRTECWYIIDCDWLADWTSFIDSKTSIPPSPISSLQLLQKRSTMTVIYLNNLNIVECLTLFILECSFGHYLKANPSCFVALAPCFGGTSAAFADLVAWARLSPCTLFACQLQPGCALSA